jgi:tagatose 1,6-diphosphate aldolase
MSALTTAERRAYQQICEPNGRMLSIAMDQRAAMRKLIAADGSASDADLVRYLGNFAPSVLLDPEFALPRVVDEGVLARDCALIVGMDGSGYGSDDAGLRVSRLVDGISARGVRRLGGTCGKLNVYMRPDREGLDAHPARMIRSVLDDCAAEDLLLVVEILTYQLDDEAPETYAAAAPALVVEAARMARECGAKVMKLQYPGSAEGCAAVTAALGGVPWAVLSAGVDHATFLGQLRIALDNGAVGAIAGRSLWKDCLSPSAEERRVRLTERGLPRLREVQATLAAGLPG